MADDLLLFSLPCFCRGAAPIGAVVIRKVTEARVRPTGAPGEGGTRIIRAGRGTGRPAGRWEGGTKLERITLVAETVETALSRHLPAGSLIRLPPFSRRADGTGRAFERAL